MLGNGIGLLFTNDPNNSNPDKLGNLDNLANATEPVTELVNHLYGPLITIVSSVAVIYCIFLGVKLAKADEPQEREKAKGALKNAIIGYLLIFVLILVLNKVSPVLSAWVMSSSAS